MRKTIFIIEKILLLNYAVFFILAPYDNKLVGKAAFFIALLGWLSISALEHGKKMFSRMGFVNPLSLQMALFGLALILSVLFSENFYHSQGVLLNRYPLYFLSFFIAFWLSGRSKSNLYFLVFSFVISSMIIAAGGVRDYFFYTRTNPMMIDRLWSVFGWRLPYFSFPLYLVYFIPFVFLAFIFLKNRVLKAVALVLSASLLGCLLWNASRAAWLAIVSGIFFAGATKLKRYKKHLAVLLLIMAVFSLASSNTRNRLKTVVYPSLWSNRVPLYSSAMKIFNDYPVFGAGLGMYEKLVSSRKYKMPEDYPIDPSLTLHAHNTYLEIAAEAGFLGLVSFAWIIINFVILAFRKLFYEKKEEISGSRVLLLGFTGLVISTGIFAFSTTFIIVGVNISVYFWLFLGIGASLLARDAGTKEKQVRYG